MLEMTLVKVKVTIEGHKGPIYFNSLFTLDVDIPVRLTCLLLATKL